MKKLSLRLPTRICLLSLLFSVFTLQLRAQSITAVSPNKGQLGDQLNVFISGQNVNFQTGSSTINTSFRQGSTTIPATYIGVSGSVLEVFLDLGNTSYPTGNYDLTVNTITDGNVVLNNAFEIDSVALKNISPRKAVVGQTFTALVVGQSVDLSTVTIPPTYTGGGNIINTTIIGTRGPDTLELSVNLSSGSYVVGNYDLSVVIPGDTLSLRNALELKTTSIKGTVFYDPNLNVVQDQGEVGLSNVRLELLPIGTLAYTNSNGEYSFSNLASGSYDVVITPLDSSFTTNTSDTQRVVINLPNEYQVDFGLNSNTTNLLRDLKMIGYYGRARCAASVVYVQQVKNQGFTRDDIVHYFVKDSSLTFRSSSITQADSVKGDTMYFSAYGVDPGMIVTEQVICDLPGITVLPIGSYLEAKSQVDVLDVSGSIIPGTSRNDSDRTIVRCSYDPNDKLVKPQGVGTDGLLLHDTPLEYTIRFQNTGNDTAYRVVVIDTLSSNLDLATFEFLTATHDVEVELKPNGILTFTFNNIFLVDSMTNEPGSNGLVKFRIRPNQGLIDSTMVLNRAGIYFDFNPPIITNYVTNTYVTSIISSLQENRLRIAGKLSPNPTKGEFEIQWNDELKNANLKVYDVRGKVVYERASINGTGVALNLSQQKRGIYFITIHDGSKFLNEKVILR